MAGVSYTLNVFNNSTQTGDTCIYQTDPNTNMPNVQSLAWFSKMSTPTTKMKFTWQVDYSFVWSETGVLVPGVVFDASQNQAADLSTSNQITFTNVGGAYDFQNQTVGPQAGTLYIRQDGTIASQAASVGIGMSGAGTFAVESQPNMSAMFTPHPVYWITFGNYVAGQVLDVATISQKKQILFPVNVYSMTATFNPDNTWSVSSTASVNSAFVTARKRDRNAVWAA